jgi:crotonobetainyl-CoA:carnitine CoA-transferase CaiB-like acyl-CoA transferase
LPSPIKVIGEDLPIPERAPTVGQHTDQVLHEVLGYDADRVAELRAAGALG